MLFEFSIVFPPNNGKNERCNIMLFICAALKRCPGYTKIYAWELEGWNSITQFTGEVLKYSPVCILAASILLTLLHTDERQSQSIRWQSIRSPGG